MKILTYPADQKLLRRVARKVRDDEFGSPAFVEFCECLGQTMIDSRGYALATTQVAEAPGGEPWAVFAIQAAKGAMSYGIMANPVITRRVGSAIDQEGCLSFGSVAETLVAPAGVILEARNKMGQPFSMALEGLAARAVCHELDHLEGRLLVDRMTRLKRQHFLRRVMRAPPAPQQLSN